MRKKWAEGTVLYTRDGAEYKITASNEAGGTAIIYYAEKAGSGIRAVLKEFYPQEWERRKGVPVERAYVDSPDEDPGLLSCYKKLAEQAAREMEISQKVARETVHVWPVRGMLEVQSIREPDGAVWQAEGTLPCCILEMDNLNHKDGLWLQDILREAGKEKSKETPLGNLQPNCKPVLAVPPLQVTLMLVWRLLILLAKIHEAGYLHGDINLGNVFLAMDDKGANVLNAMLIDFGSARALVDGKTAPLGKESVMATPGFAAPELKGGGEQRLTPKADVYAVGKLMHCLLDQNILEALRKGWYSDLEEELKAPTLDASGINDPQLTPAVQKSLDQILSGAAEIEPEKRSSVQEMMEQIMQLYRKIEPPAWQMSLGLLQLNGDEVLGRDKDIQKIEAKLWAEGKLVLHGFSGIGKTKLVTLLGHKWQRNYPCSQVYYAFYPGSMTGLAVDTLARNMSTVAFTEQKDGKDVPRPVAGIIDDMFRELNAHMHENDLLIIDNVDDDTQEYWDSVVHEETVQGQTDLFTRLCQLNCKVLFVTRLDVSNVTGIVPFEVDRLELEPLRAILRENSKDAKGRSDAQKRSDEELDRLIALVDRHTMTVDMIARTMRESRLTVPEIYKELSCDGYGSGAFVEISGQKDTDYSKNRIEGHLIRLFRLANFNEREQDMLRYAQLIGENSGMYETLFLSCCPHESKDENTKNLEALNHLLRLGYVQQKTEEDSEEVILNLHTLVRVVARKEFCITEEDKEAFYKSVMGNPTFRWVTSNPFYCFLFEECASCQQLADSFQMAAFYMDPGFEWAYWKSYSVRFALLDLDHSPLKDDFISDVMTLIAIAENRPQWFESTEKAPSWRCARFYENLFYGAERFGPEDVRSNISKRTLWLYLVYGLGRAENDLKSPILSAKEERNWSEVKRSLHRKAVALWEQQDQPDRVSLKELYLDDFPTVEEFSAFQEKALENLKKCPQADALDYADFYSITVARSYRASENDEQVERALQKASYYEEQYLRQLSTQTTKLSERSKPAWRALNRHCDGLVEKGEYEKASRLIDLLEKFSVDECDAKELLKTKAKYCFGTGRFQECIDLCASFEKYEFYERDEYIIKAYKQLGEPEKALEIALTLVGWPKYKDAIAIADELYSTIASSCITEHPETAEGKAFLYIEWLIENEKRRVKQAQEGKDYNRLDQVILSYKNEFLFAVYLQEKELYDRDFLIKEIQWVTKAFSEDKSDWTFQQQDLYGEIYFRYVRELYNDEKYQEALEALDEFEAAGLEDLERVWKAERRQEAREKILKKLNGSSKVLSNETHGSGELEEIEELEEDPLEIERNAERAYLDGCKKLKAEKNSHDMIEPFCWDSWDRLGLNGKYWAKDLEGLLLSVVHANWNLEHFERASQNAQMWAELQPEGSVGFIRALAILANCCCHQKCYTPTLSLLIYMRKNMQTLLKNVIKQYTSSTSTESEGRLLVNLYDVDFWNQWISELEDVLPENHPILVAAHFHLVHIYRMCYRLKLEGRFGRKAGRFESMRFLLKTLKELPFALFHNWNSWWEPDT